MLLDYDIEKTIRKMKILFGTFIYLGKKGNKIREKILYVFDSTKQT